MSQHDFNIANQGFPAFRADLNNALGALATNSAGTTEPDTTYAYQYWYDETTDLLKMRNGADDAWITLAAFDQTNDEWEVRSAVIQAVDSAGVSIKTNDGTTRFSISDAGVVSFENYAFPSADGSANQVLATDGSGTLSFIDSSGDKIEEGNSSVEVVDTGSGYITATTDGTERLRINSSGRVGIGTTSPLDILHISSSAPKIRLTDTNSSLSAQIDYDTGVGNLSIRSDMFDAGSAPSITFYVGADDVASMLEDGTFRFNSGYGSAATAYGCRAWVNFNGTGTVAINEDGNVSSITDNGTGNYTVNFTTAMPDVSYATTVGGALTGGGIRFAVETGDASRTTSSFGVKCFTTGISSLDLDRVNVAIFR